MKQTYQGSCHCDKVRFEVDADLDHVRVCDCSVCRRRGALNHRVPPDDLRFLTPIEDLSLDVFHTQTARDYFCPVCGIQPFRRPRGLSPSEAAAGMPRFEGWAVNVRCLDDVDLEAIPVKRVFGSRLP